MKPCVPLCTFQKPLNKRFIFLKRFNIFQAFDKITRGKNRTGARNKHIQQQNTNSKQDRNKKKPLYVCIATAHAKTR